MRSYHCLLFWAPAKPDKEKAGIIFACLDESPGHEKEEATEAIQEVISRYGYAPEFLGLEKQVGAVVSSLNKVSPEPEEK